MPLLALFLCSPVSGALLARAPAPRMMGGLTGLPRMPVRAWPLTKQFNPGGEYNEQIATLWRDLELVYGSDEATFRAVKRLPSLVNPQVSNRFIFAKTKSVLVQLLGSEPAAIDLLSKDPSLLQAAPGASYESLNPRVERMAAGEIPPTAAGGMGGAAAPLFLLVAVGAVAAAANYLGFSPS